MSATLLGWLTMASGLSLVAVLGSRQAWRRLVVYHVDPSALRPMTQRTLGASLHIIAEAQERLAKDRRSAAR